MRPVRTAFYVSEFAYSTRSARNDTRACAFPFGMRAKNSIAIDNWNTPRIDILFWKVKTSLQGGNLLNRL